MARAPVGATPLRLALPRQIHLQGRPVPAPGSATSVSPSRPTHVIALVCSPPFEAGRVLPNLSRRTQADFAREVDAGDIELTRGRQPVHFRDDTDRL
jgi:hypothetical protein